MYHICYIFVDIVIDMINVQWRELRKRFGVRISDVSRKTGISRSMIHRFEKGESDMTIRNFQKMLDCINFEIIIVYETGNGKQTEGTRD